MATTHIKQFSKEFEFVNHNWVRIVLPVTAPNEPITQVEFRLQLREKRRNLVCSSNVAKWDKAF